MTRTAVCVLAVLLLSPRSFSQFVIPSGSHELKTALARLNVLGTALYVAAHPDDENTAVIAALSKGRHIRTAYLSMTRGEGGQNLIGSEQGSLLGILRTQELLAARALDGGRQFFTRAIDFGYSKTSEETIGIWNRERIVGDIVWIIRSFRPDVIMTRFSDTLGTHGNHTGSAILTKEAFEAAGDPARFPEQLAHVRPWKPARLVFNVFRFGSSGMDPSPRAVALDVGAFSPVLGESFSEIAGRSRSMHKSQGFGAAENRGSNLQYFEPTAGNDAVRDLFDGVEIGWKRVRGGRAVEELIEQAQKEFDPEHPSRIIPLLIRAYRILDGLENDPWVDIKKGEIRDVIAGCAGLWVEAIAEDHTVSPGRSVPVTVMALNRSGVSAGLRSVRFPFAGNDTTLAAPLENNKPVRARSVVRIPADQPYSQPSWLRNPPKQGSYELPDQRDIGRPDDSPLTAKARLEIEGWEFELDVPVEFRRVDPVRGEVRRPLVIVPDISLRLTEPVVVFTGGEEKSIRVILSAVGSVGKGSVRVEAPPGWVIRPASAPFDLKKKGDATSVTFTVRPANGSTSGPLRAMADIEGRLFQQEVVTIEYDHIRPQVAMREAVTSLLMIPMKKPGGIIGYIKGPGDGVESALVQLGYSVRVLTDEDLESADLKAYDVIVAGVRAYNTRPTLRAQQQRLMEYVRNGGRYVVQYVTRQGGESENLGPYPLNVSRDRVTVEGAPVTFVDPRHPMLNTPLKLGAADFDGWVQERGLYFADSWDARYQAILSSHDPGEPPRTGGLLFGRYGKGEYLYVAYSLFRQLPAGVPGAYRLLVNLVSRN